jgi:hypothetical protein
MLKRKDRESQLTVSPPPPPKKPFLTLSWSSSSDSDETEERPSVADPARKNTVSAAAHMDDREPRPAPLTMDQQRKSFVLGSPKKAFDTRFSDTSTNRKVDDDDDIVDLTGKPNEGINISMPPKTLPPKKKRAPKKKVDKTVPPAQAPPAEVVEKAPKKAPKNDWPGIAALVKATGVKSVTTVDPGTRNCAVARIEFRPKTCITHAKVIDMDELVKDYEAEHPEVHLGVSNGVTERRLFVWQAYVRHEMMRGGCFDSDALLVEDQAHIFDPVMGRVEAVTIALFNAERPAIRATSASVIPSGQLVNSRSVKALYRPLFPPLPGAPTDAEQRLENKRNAKKYGTLICPQKRLLEIVEHLTARDRARLSKAQMHDFYDCFFMMGWFVSCFLFNLHKLARDEPNANDVGAFDKPPQRPRNKWQELIEFCFDLGTPAANVEALMTILTGELLDE